MSGSEKPNAAGEWAIWAAVAALGAYFLLIALLWKADVLRLTGVLALLGGLFAAILTFVGVLVKYSLDRRTLELARQTEARLTVETLFKGVDLLTRPDGTLALPIQQAGALFTLAHGGYHELALMHLNEVWGKGNHHHSCTPAN